MGTIVFLLEDGQTSYHRLGRHGWCKTDSKHFRERVNIRLDMAAGEVDFLRKQNEKQRGGFEMSAEARREFSKWLTAENARRCRIVKEMDAYRPELLKRLGRKRLPEGFHEPCRCKGTHCSAHVTGSQRILNELKRKESEAKFALFAERRRNEKRGSSLFKSVLNSTSSPSTSIFEQEVFNLTRLIGMFDGELHKIDEMPRHIFRSDSI